MTSARFQLRAALGLGVLVVALMALIGRLASIQLCDGPALAEAAGVQQDRDAEDVHAPRGALLDRRRRVLAQTVFRPSIGVDPRYIRIEEETDAVVRAFEEEFGVDVRPILAKSARIGDSGEIVPIQFQYVLRRIPDDAAVERFRKRLADESIRGVPIVYEPVRAHPAGVLASQVVGFTLEEAEGPRGVAGAEFLADEWLRGRRGRVHARRDNRRRTVRLGDHEYRPAWSGEDVRLTIDAVIQTHAEEILDAIMEEHAPDSAVAAVLDVRTGELLAVAVRPGFDPSAVADSLPAEQRNRFFTDAYPPGSVFKPIAMAIALESGAVRPGQRIDCSANSLHLAHRRIREDEYKQLGVLTPAGVIALSSNVGMAHIALAIGIPAMRDGIKRFGFGRTTGSGWPAESRGLVTPDRLWKEEFTLLSVSFGQEMSATPAQILMAYGALANGGLLHRPRVFVDAPVVAPERVVSPGTLAALTPMMEAVLTEGTAKRVDTRGYRVAGKTGTAQRMTKQGVDGHVASFACFGPVSDPRLAVFVLADRPSRGRHYGSVVAAPGAVALLHDALRYLDVPPDGDRPASVAARTRHEVSPR